MASLRTVTTADGNMLTRLPKAARMDLVTGTLALRPYVFAFLVLFLVAGRPGLGWRRALRFGASVRPGAWVGGVASTPMRGPVGRLPDTGITPRRGAVTGHVR